MVQLGGNYISLAAVNNRELTNFIENISYI